MKNKTPLMLCLLLIIAIFFSPPANAQMVFIGSGERVSDVEDKLSLWSWWDGLPPEPLITKYKVEYFVKIGEATTETGTIDFWDPVGQRSTAWVPGHFASLNPPVWVPAGWTGDMELVDAGGLRNLNAPTLEVRCNSDDFDAETFFHPNGIYEVRILWQAYREGPEPGWFTMADEIEVVSVFFDDFDFDMLDDFLEILSDG